MSSCKLPWLTLKMEKMKKNWIKQSFQVLLDSGSQQTYISEGITDKLKLTPIEKNFLRFTDLEQESRNASKHQLWKLQWYWRVDSPRKLKWIMSQTLLVQLKEHHSGLKPSNKHWNNMSLLIQYPWRKEIATVTYWLGTTIMETSCWQRVLCYEMGCTCLDPNLDGYYLEVQKMNIQLERGIPWRCLCTLRVKFQSISLDSVR